MFEWVERLAEWEFWRAMKRAGCCESRVDSRLWLCALAQPIPEDGHPNVNLDDDEQVEHAGKCAPVADHLLVPALYMLPVRLLLPYLALRGRIRRVEECGVGTPSHVEMTK